MASGHVSEQNASDIILHGNGPIVLSFDLPKFFNQFLFGGLLLYDNDFVNPFNAFQNADITLVGQNIDARVGKRLAYGAAKDALKRQSPRYLIEIINTLGDLVPNITFLPVILSLIR